MEPHKMSTRMIVCPSKTATNGVSTSCNDWDRFGNNDIVGTDLQILHVCKLKLKSVLHTDQNLV